MQHDLSMCSFEDDSLETAIAIIRLSLKVPLDRRSGNYRVVTRQNDLETAH